MVQPYPLPRETRESEILHGDGVSTVFGPFAFKIFDTADVTVLARPQNGLWAEAAVTVTKTTADALAFFTVTFAPAVPTTTDFVVLGKRLGERQTDMTRGGTINTPEMEKEFSKIVATQQELRRDVDRSLTAEPGSEPLQPLPLPAPGRPLIWRTDGLGLTNGAETYDGLRERVDATEAKNLEQDSRLSSVESKNSQQDDRLSPIEAKNTEQDTLLLLHETRLSAAELKNDQQDNRLYVIDAQLNTIIPTVTGLTLRAEAAAESSETSAQQAQDLVEAATAGFTGFEQGQAYDFGWITDETTYFDQDWGTL